MRASVYLKKLEKKETILRQMLEEFKEFIATEEGVKGIIYKDKVQTSKDGDLSDTMARKEELLAKINIKKMDYTQYRAEVVENIHKLSKVSYLEVLYNRYIKKLTYKEIASVMGYTASHVKTLHREACEELENTVLNNTN